MIRTKIIYRVYGPKGKAILATPKRSEAYKGYARRRGAL